MFEPRSPKYGGVAHGHSHYVIVNEGSPRSILDSVNIEFRIEHRDVLGNTSHDEVVVLHNNPDLRARSAKTYVS